MTDMRRESAVPAQAPRRDRARERSSVQRVKDYFRKGFCDWIREFLNHKYLIAFSLVLVVVATYLDYYSGVYVSSTPGIEVPDLILDHVGPIDLSPLFVYGYIALIVGLFSYPLLFHIRTLHVVVSQFSLLVMLRSVFMIFTHLETPPDAILATFPWIFEKLSFQNDMFFSGHTAIPLLGFFLFRRSPIRYLFLAGSIVMAIVVLAMHLHYSIDVFSAFFITYCSCRIGNAAIRQIDPAYQE